MTAPAAFPADHRYVVVPGYLDSDAGHWQTLWQAELGDLAVRLSPSSWTEPDRDDWVAALDAAMASSVPNRGGAVIVAHSLGCLTALEWLVEHPGEAAGVFLVALPDPEGPDFPDTITGFARPTAPVGVPALMAASTDDPYAGLAFSRGTAGRIGAELVEIESGGHLSTASGRGPWPDGRALFTDFLARLS